MPSKKIIEYAIKQANSSEGEFRLAAVLYKGGSVLRIVSNSPKRLGYRQKFFWHGEPSRHAELSAIHAIPRDVITKCSLLVVRVNRAGELTSAKPCEACAMALHNAQIKKVYYSSYDGTIKKFDLNQINFDNYTKETLIR